MRTAELVLRPETTPPRRSHGPVAILALSVALLGGVMATPAIADEAPQPTQPQPVLILNDDCTATLSLVDIVPGRAYDLTVTDSVGASVVDLSFIATDSVLDSFATVAAGSHALRVTDTAAPEFTATRSVDVAPCTTTEAVVTSDTAVQDVEPSLTVIPHECDLLGATDVRVEGSSLGAGSYPVGVVADGVRVPGVADLELTADTSSAVIPDLPNGDSYEVWMKAPDGEVVDSHVVELPICDLPTLDEPVAAAPTETAGVSSGSLASTGQPVFSAAIVAAIAALQAGALIVGIALLRGRGRGEHRA